MRSPSRTVAIAAAATAVTLVVVLVVVLRAGDGSGPSGPSGRGEARPSASPTPLADVVETTSGPVRGVSNGVVRAWLGLPYAAPPTGARRWRPPQPARPWDDVREASAYGDSCVQPDVRGRSGGRLRGSSEDCLFVNVSRPDDDAEGLPVMVWLHGGGFFAGNGATATAAAQRLVERGVVLVTVNYRLGRLGFFAHPALGGDVGNFGLLDQVAALRWTRDNAAAFGGDAGNVTVFGGSAGAMSVNALMAMPSADGLFQRAVSQSAPSDQRALSLAEARQRGAQAFPGLSPAQLRALPAEQLLSTSFNTLAGEAPLVDAVLPESAAAAFRDGSEVDVPYLVGTTAEEFDDDAFRSYQVDPVALRGALGGGRHAELVRAYGDDYDAHVLNDTVFDLPALERAVAHGGRAPTYRYVFRSSQSVRHGSEAPYVFDVVAGGDDGRLADAVADYWVAFARTGAPEVPGLPRWPTSGPETPTAYLEIAPGGPTPRASDARAARLSLLRDVLS